jgi:hypothetical protein
MEKLIIAIIFKCDYNNIYLSKALEEGPKL